MEIDLDNDATAQTVYTTPTERKTIPTSFVFRDATSELGAGWPDETIQIGRNGSAEYFVFDSNDGNVGIFKQGFSTAMAHILEAGDELTAQVSTAFNPGETIIVDAFGYELIVPPPPPFSPIALIASAQANDSGGGGEDPTTGAIDTTGANFLVMMCSAINGRDLTPSDSKGNTWVSAKTLTANNMRVEIFIAENAIVGSGHTFHANSPYGDSYASIAAAAFSNVKTASSTDQTNSNGSATAGSITPTEDNELVIAAISASGGSTGIGGGFTVAQFVSGPVRGGLAYLIQSTAAAANPTWSSVSGNLSSAIASFKHS